VTESRLAKLSLCAALFVAASGIALAQPQPAPPPSPQRRLGVEQGTLSEANRPATATLGPTREEMAERERRLAGEAGRGRRDPSNSFWTSTIGILTALTGLVGACATVIVAVRGGK
jgi:hypothetical protein